MPDTLADLMSVAVQGAIPGGPPKKPRRKTIDEIIEEGIGPEAPPFQGSPMPRRMQPTPTNPWGGLEVFDWKNPGPYGPQSIGTVRPGPSRDDLQLLQLLGRRRMPSNISGVGGG